MTIEQTPAQAVARARWPDPVAAAATFALGALLVALGVTGLWSGAFVGAGTPESDWWYLLPLAVACGAMLLKRRAPRIALVIATGALLADLYLGSSLGTLLAFYDVLYSAAIAATPRLRRVLVGGAVVGIAGPALAALFVGADLRVALFVALQLFALLATPLWWASDVRKRNEIIALAAERTADLERIHTLSRERAVADERTAMAREVHDVVASHMSAIAIRSAAALATPPDAGRDRAALEAIRESALAAHGDMRSMITLLRATTPAPLEAATIADLGPLVDRARDMGVSVALQGVGPDAAADVDPQTQNTVYRITQEALVNAAKHAPGGHVVVRVSALGEGGIDLSVRSARTVGGASAEASSAHDGVGLVTMAERARAVGGELDVRSTDTEWVVAARLPGAGS